MQLFSIIQILRARKLDDYGAYQLTLIPYALMSLVNVTSGILTPSYPAVYMIDSTVMEEARRRGGIFDGVIGQLDEDAEVVMTKMIAGGSEPSTDLRATEGSESSINPKEVGESEKSTHSKVEAQSKQPADPSTGGRRHFKRREREKPLISFGGFHAANNPAFLAGGYFHHLARSFPLLRLIKDPFMRRLIADKISGSFTDHKAEKEKKSSQRIFQRIYNKRPVSKSNSNGYYAVLEIGNVQHEISVRSAMPLIMDIVMIIALALPYVTIYALTGFNAPTGSERVHGIVFMLWLTVGQVLPFFLVPSWNLINLEIWRVKLNWRMFWGFLCTSVFTMAAFAGFYFVGEMRYQELTLNNSNCSKSRITFTQYMPATDFK